MFVFVSFLSIFAPCVRIRWRAQIFVLERSCFKFEASFCSVASKHFGFEPRLLFRHFCFEAALLFKHFGWKPLQAKTFFKHFSFERFYSILCFNATLYCSNMFQATIFFKYVGGLKFGFRSKTFFRLLVSKQTFFKKFWEKFSRKDKSLQWMFFFFFCLIGSTASKQTILANVQLLSMLAKKNEENV